MPGCYTARMLVGFRMKLWIHVVLAAAVVGGYVAHAWYFRAYVNDDAYITFRYSRFLAEGRGPYYNVGEHVEGYTNFLLMLLLAGVIKLAGTGVVPVVAKVLGVGGGVLGLLAAWGLCARWLRRVTSVAPYANLIAWAAPALVAVNAAYALNSMSGLETTLLSGWLLLGLWLVQVSYDQRRWRAAGVAFALAALTRPEGILAFVGVIFGGVLAGVLRDSRRRTVLLLDTLIVAVVVAAHVVFRWICYEGEWLPNTFYAKTGGASWAIDAETYIRKFASYHLGGWAALICLAVLVLRESGGRRSVLPALLVCLLALAGLFKTGPDWMIGYRPLVPYAPIWAALCVTGVAAVADRLCWRPVALTVGVCALLLVWVSGQGEPRRAYFDYCRTRARGYEAGHAALARWLGEHTAPGDAVALMDIGIVGYACPDLRILDITGLTDRHIAKSPGPFLAKDYDPAYVLDQRPEFIVLVTTRRRRPDGRLEYVPWTRMEHRLMSDERFRQHYYHPRAPRAVDVPYEPMAAAFGAARVFKHDHPTATYLLVVHQYRS